MILPAVSIKQPWASKIADGDKSIETRTWETQWRGPILVVSSKQPDPSFPASETAGLPMGKALAVTLLAKCRPMTPADRQAADCECYPRAKAWVFKGLWPVRPFNVQGARGLYDQYLDPEHCFDREIYGLIKGYLDRAIARGFRWRKGKL